MTKPEMTDEELYVHCYTNAHGYLDWLYSMAEPRSIEEKLIRSVIGQLTLADQMRSERLKMKKLKANS